MRVLSKNALTIASYLDPKVITKNVICSIPARLVFLIDLVSISERYISQTKWTVVVLVVDCWGKNCRNFYGFYFTIPPSRSTPLPPIHMKKFSPHAQILGIYIEVPHVLNTHRPPDLSSLCTTPSKIILQGEPRTQERIQRKKPLSYLIQEGKIKSMDILISR